MSETLSSGTITLDGSGAATVYFPVEDASGRAISGSIAAIRYIKAGSGAFVGTTWTFTNEATGEALLTMAQAAASTTRYPRANVHDTSGVAITGVYDMIAIANGRIKLAITGGTPGQTGSFFVVVI